MRGHLLGHERREDLASGRHNLLAYNDQFRVQVLSRPRSGSGVVIGDDEAVKPLAPRRRDQIPRACQRILRSVRVAVKFDVKLHIEI
jgi:hypothetical protein